MDRDHLDEILSSAEDLVPSPSFIKNLMAIVQDEAAAPPPIPFPWSRAVPGLAVVNCTFVVFLVVALAPSSNAPSQLVPGMSSILYPIVEAAKNIEAGWIVVALVF